MVRRRQGRCEGHIQEAPCGRAVAPRLAVHSSIRPCWLYPSAVRSPAKLGRAQSRSHCCEERLRGGIPSQQTGPLRRAAYVACRLPASLGRQVDHAEVQGVAPEISNRSTPTAGGQLEEKHQRTLEDREYCTTVLVIFFLKFQIVLKSFIISFDK